MAGFCIAWLALLLPAQAVSGAAAVHDPVRAQYQDAIGSAPVDGLPSFVAKLDAAAIASPASEFTPRLLETIQLVGILHPGVVPDQTARLDAMRAQAGSNAELAAVVKQLDQLRNYYAAVAAGKATQAASLLPSPTPGDSPQLLQARADAEFRAGNLRAAQLLAQNTIEADVFSPLLAPTYVLLGITDAYMGKRQSAARHFQRALALSPTPTIYGRTQDLLSTLSRLVRPTPGAVGEIFDEMSAVRVSGTTGLKDPRTLLFAAGKFILGDREQILSLSSEGRVIETRTARNLEDIVASPSGKFYHLADDSVDLGTGTLVRVSVTMAGRQRALSKLRSFALHPNGDVYFLDQDMGLFRAPGSSPTSLVSISPARGRLLRIDARGNLFLLGVDQRSIAVLSPDGKPLTTVSTAAGGRESSIEYFALDTFGNLYVLDSGTATIQVFAITSTGSGVEKERLATVPLDPRPHHKNLKVISVSPTGEVAVTGRNEDTWVLYR
jgi:hypothetical protein